MLSNTGRPLPIPVRLQSLKRQNVVNREANRTMEFKTIIEYKETLTSIFEISFY